MTSSFVQLLLLQFEIFRHLILHPRLFVAVVIYWVERVGTGLGIAVVPFYYLELGLTPTMMGQLSTAAFFFSILPSPVYGWIQDRFGPLYTIMLSSGACAVGCLIRGTATSFENLLVSSSLNGFGGGNMMSMVTAHLASLTPPDQRALVLSAVSLQAMCLKMGGQLLYPFWDEMLALGVESRMLRFRVTLSVCTLFCFFGVVNLAVNGKLLLGRDRTALIRARGPTIEAGTAAEGGAEQSTVKRSPPAAGATTSGFAFRKLFFPERASSARGTPKDGAMAMVQDGQVAADEKGCSASPALVSTLLVLFLVKACAVMLDTIWPLFLKAHFGWQEREYSLLLFSQSVSSILFLAVFPSIIRWLGDAMTLLLLGLAAAVTMGLAFALQSPAGLALPGHVALMLLTYGVLNTMDPCVKAVASSLVPPSAQGRTFAALNICSALGSMLSGLVAPRLYERCAPPAP